MPPKLYIACIKKYCGAKFCISARELKLKGKGYIRRWLYIIMPIVIGEEIYGEKPVIRETCISVEFVLELLSNG